MITVRYLYSACIVITTPECSILTDPWFGEAYDGAWVQWPVIQDPLKACGKCDIIFLSHVHPDHYDPGFLRQYLDQYPETEVLIAKQTPPLLERKLRARGIEPVVGLQRVGETMLDPIANANNFDSALMVFRDGLKVINMNDNPIDYRQLSLVKGLHAETTVAFLPFVGAGPWPQAYDFDDPEQQLLAAKKKKLQYLELFARYANEIKPTVAVPFAGQYWLHSEQIDLNPLRGMADATECIGLYPDVWVPADGGQSQIDLGTLHERGASTARTQPYDWQEVRKALPKRLYKRYEMELRMPPERLPLLKLLQAAARNVWEEFHERRPNLYIAIKAEPLQKWFLLNTANTTVSEIAHVTAFDPRYEVYLDARYLFGGLTRLYNMNNVRIGSLARFKVVPMEPFDEQLYDLFGQYFDSLRV